MTVPAVLAQPVVAPAPSQNQVDAMGVVSAVSTARHVIEGHVSGLRARRQRDLLSEKYLLHVDGTDDFQWADILYGEKVEIPRDVSEFRKTENLLRPIVDNAVSHHTSMPLRYFADSRPDRRARDSALIDSLWMNDLTQRQDLNGLFADALYSSMPAGFCPVHCYWREDGTAEYEPVPGAEGLQMGPGMIDCWVGNPWDTVFDRGATRASVHWCSYGRLLPADLVRRAFAHVPGVEGLQGTTRIPSASIFQRIAKDWRSVGLGIHGSATIDHRRHLTGESEEELMVIVCREVLPGFEADWPDGRLQIVAVPGTVDLRRGEGKMTAVLLADQALPARTFSWTNFYSHHRGDDIHGKPWVADLDETQVDLNIALSKWWQFMNKFIDAPMMAPGGVLQEDMLDLDGYNLIEIDPTAANWRPQVMHWQTEPLQFLEKYVESKRRTMYTIGGYQASSRGESPGSRTPYRAILALQSADNTIHGPINIRFRRSACDFARRCWWQMKTYGDIPQLIETVGDEYAHLAEPYIDRTKLSERPPNYKLVNAFGTPEARAQEVLELMTIRGADGEVFLTTEQARRLYPNQAPWDSRSDPKAVARRRAKTVAIAIEQDVRKFREQTGFDIVDVAHPWTAQAANQVFMTMEAMFPRLQDDDLAAHIAHLSEITQDETADPIARLAARQRQQLYYQWQAQMAGINVAPTGDGPEGTAPRGPTDRNTVAQEMSGRTSPGMLEAGG